MDAFVVKKRQRDNPCSDVAPKPDQAGEEEESTEVKLAILVSILPDYEQSVLFEALLSCDGVVEAAINMLTIQGDQPSSPKRRRVAPSVIGYQSSLSKFVGSSGITSSQVKSLTKKGKTLYLYSPEDIATHTPCSIIHNFLPPDVADLLLHELLHESLTFGRETFRLFDNVVTSPHSMSFYVDDLDLQAQKTEYVYNGSYIADVRKTPDQMRLVSQFVRKAVNDEIQKRIRSHYGGKKLQYQSPKEWSPNTAFVNCYDGGKESVGYHADQLTYLGPRAVIGSLSLGVAREFRVRKVVARDDEDGDIADEPKKKQDTARADSEGQISIHLPHNSLLVMHAEMQEEWKHAIAPAQTIDPHPIAGNKRLNITYRCYRNSFHPKYTPRCRCGVPTVLRCSMKKKGSRGRYMWMCHAQYTPEQKGCVYFKLN